MAVLSYTAHSCTQFSISVFPSMYTGHVHWVSNVKLNGGGVWVINLDGRPRGIIEPRRLGGQKPVLATTTYSYPWQPLLYLRVLKAAVRLLGWPASVIMCQKVSVDALLTSGRFNGDVWKHRFTPSHHGVSNIIGTRWPKTIKQTSAKQTRFSIFHLF